MTSPELISMCAQCSIPIILILIGYFAGSVAERVHLKKLDEREDASKDVLVTDVRAYDQRLETAAGGSLVIGSVVIGTDYFKRFLAIFPKLFGGELTSYERVLLRARREAMLRMIEDARDRGFNAICNVRVDTADIGGNAVRKKGAGAMVGIVAVGTAYRIHAATPPIPQDPRVIKDGPFEHAMT